MHTLCNMPARRSSTEGVDATSDAKPAVLGPRKTNEQTVLLFFFFSRARGAKVCHGEGHRVFQPAHRSAFEGDA